METNYHRGSYGELYTSNREFEIWQNANTLIKQAARKKKILASFDGIKFDRKGRADGAAVHHEIYDIHPDPLRVLVCVRETEGNRYGVKTTSKRYFIIKKHGKGVRVNDAKKSIAAKASKAAECELGCAINVVEGKTKLNINRACPDGIAFKKLAIGLDGRLYSIYDGSAWNMGTKRSDRAMKNHNGGLYVYETVEGAKGAPFPTDSELLGADTVVVKCRVAGNYCRYGNKLAFSHVTPINIEEIVE